MRTRKRVAASHMRWIMRTDDGALTLEATISVTIFSMLAAFLVTLFPMYASQNMMAHALLQTAESLSLDTYASEQALVAAASSTSTTVPHAIQDYAQWDLTGNDYASAGSWYRSRADSYYADPADSKVIDAVKDRLAAYLAGGESEVGDYFLTHHINASSMDDLNFEGTCVRDKILYIVVSYEYEDAYGIMSALGIGPFEASATASARLWIA